MAWLQTGPGAAAAAVGTGMCGTLLIAVPWGVMYWPVDTQELPRALVLCERPQLLAGALPDRLLCVELDGGVSAFAGTDRPGPEPAAHAFAPSVPCGPRARVRTRPISLLEPVMFAARHAPASVGADAVAALGDAHWRMAPAELPEGLPAQVVRTLWPVASCSEAPPQLLQSASVYYRLARAASDEFRGPRRARHAGCEHREPRGVQRLPMLRAQPSALCAAMLCLRR
eukprot:NODE_10370_length_1357_cov_2.765854.p1 GENE.NODE_10370_length_1357_cov_2.765854~~NODE_10370_length_1357_cov_2.765854.p1  ORF type:complete len:268 (-),score=77.23 NODE_10370_length_1357_cov_2.765854:552-1235(-)